MQKNIVFVVSAIVALLIAAGFGVMIAKQTQQRCPVAQPPAKTILDSRAVVGVSVSGKVSNINSQNKTITVGAGNEAVPLKVADNAVILFYDAATAADADASANTKAGQATQKGKAAFSDIKIGNTVYVRASFFSNRQLQATSVFIMTK